MSAAISCTDLRYQWPGGFTLEIPQWEVGRGERVAIKGRSGCGKSTLLGLLSGELVATSGALRVLDHPLRESDERSRRLHRLQSIGQIFQDHPLVPHLSVLDNVLLPFRIHPSLRLDESAVDRARGLLERLDLRREMADRYPNALSEGERQRVAIARALVNEPALLLADEPTTGLDTARADTLLSLLDDLVRENGCTLVLVSHRPEVLARFAQQLDLDAVAGGGAS